MRYRMFSILLSCIVGVMVIGCASRRGMELQTEAIETAESHGRVGEGLEKLYADRIEEYYEELAFHYSRSDDKEKAIHYLVKAGDKSRGVYANEQAIGYYNQALELTNEIQGIAPSTRGHIYLSLAEVYKWIRDHEIALDFARKALQYSDDKKQRIRSYWIMGKIYEHEGKLDTALEHLNAGIAEVGDDTESPEMAMILAALFWVELYKGNTEEAIEIALRGLKIVEETEYYSEIADLYICLLWVYTHPEYDRIDMDTGFEYARKSLEAAQKSNDSFHIGQATFWLGWMHMQRREDDIAIAHMKEAMEIYKKIGHNFSIRQCYSWLSGIYLKRRDLRGLMDMTSSILER